MADTGGPNTGPPDTGGGNLLTRKMAGLPTWGWVGISAAVGIVALVWLQNRKKNALPAAADASATTAPQVFDSSGLATGQYESLLALLRDVQGQPSEQLPGPAGPPGPTGPPGSTPTTLPAPTGVRVESGAWTDAVAVYWAPVPGASSYIIKGAEQDRETVGPITGVMVFGLKHNGSYFVSVAAKDSSGRVGAFSQPITAHTKN